MPFVTIHHDPNCFHVKGEFIKALVLALPKIVADNIESLSSDPDGVLVNTAPYSPYAMNTPSVHIHVSLKDKYHRREHVRLIENKITAELRKLVSGKLKELAEGLIDSKKISVTVDVVTRSHGFV